MAIRIDVKSYIPISKFRFFDDHLFDLLFKVSKWGQVDVSYSLRHIPTQDLQNVESTSNLSHYTLAPIQS